MLAGRTRIHRAVLGVLAASVAVALLGSLATAVADTAADAPVVANLPTRPMPGFTAEREAAALTFVRTHHRELAELLMALKENDQPAYQRAIQDLFKTSERMAQIQERQPARYEIDLQSWKLRSRIELLVARLSMVDDPKLRRELRNAFLEQLEVERELLRMERDRLRDRLKVVEGSLGREPDQIAAEVDQRLDRALRRIGRQPSAKKTGDEPAAKDEKSKDNEKPKDNKERPAPAAATEAESPAKPAAKPRSAVREP